ncbi:MAG: hypothetical protein AMXMBFR53_15560 [Gemmatimonadota bacterium]
MRPGRRGYWSRRVLGAAIREPDTGRILPDAERRALRLGAELHAALQEGRDPGSVVLARGPALGLHDGFARYLDVGSGAFAVDSRHRRALVRMATRIEGLLGAGLPWAALGPDAAERVWRALAAKSRAGEGRSGAEQAVRLLLAAAAWLRLRGLIPAAAGPTPVPRWRHRLALEWQQLTGRAASAPTRPRYSLDEARALLRAAERPATDPRLRLALLLAGPELRLAQFVQHVRRSDLDLSLGFGVVELRGRGTKGGAIVALDARARAAVDAALTDGHLADLEAAYRGAGEDYALFPGGRTVAGRYPAGRRPLRAMSTSTLRAAYRVLEAAAGVTHRAGRGAHGLRRTAAQLASEQCAETPLLDALGGWQGGGVRERCYLDADAESVVRRTHQLRARVRAELRGR